MVEEKDERSDDNNQWIDFLESDLDDIEQMLIDNHIDEDAISDILDKLIQFKEGLARRVIGSRGREVLAHLLPNIFTQIFEQKNYRTLLPRILNIIDKIASRTTYLELLLEILKPLSSLLNYVRNPR